MPSAVAAIPDSVLKLLPDTIVYMAVSTSMIATIAIIQSFGPDGATVWYSRNIRVQRYLQS